MHQGCSGALSDECHVVVKWSYLGKMWFLKTCRFFEVTVIDDVNANALNDIDCLIMVNSYMHNDGALMYEKCRCYIGEVLFERMHYWVICSCIHK